MKLAPIALFAYNRPAHLARTLEALARNELAAESELFIFSDGPKSSADRDTVQSVRNLAANFEGFKSVRLIDRPENLGLARSIISGVTQLSNEFGRVIVVEDDLVTSPFFLRYLNEALVLYKDDLEVISVHGYLYPTNVTLPITFFIKGADCWGWATWKRGWDLFNADGSKLLAELESRNLTQEFDFDGKHPYTQMLRDQIAGRNNSWAIRWYASAFLQNKLTLYPGRSLIRNIGLDSSGVHCDSTDAFESELAAQPVVLEKLALEECKPARQAFAEFFKSTHPKDAPAGGWGIGERLKKINQLFRAQPKGKKAADRIFFDGDYRDWAVAAQNSKGYDAGVILEKTCAALLQVKNGQARYERDSVLYDQIQHSFPVLAGLLRAALAHGGRLCVVDYGGALGSSYFQCRDFLKPLQHLEWLVVEQPAHVARGKEKFESDQLRFYSTLEDGKSTHQPGVLLLSSVLQYLPRPYEVLQELLKHRISQVIVDRTAFLVGDRERLTVQHVPDSIYPASYPAWFLNESKFRATLESAGYELVADFPCIVDDYSPEGGKGYYKGFIFELREGLK